MRAANNETQRSIVKTLSYSDIFGYPLTKEEVHRFYIGRKKTSKKDIWENILILIKVGVVVNDCERYYLSGRKGLSEARDKKKIYSRNKMPIAIKAANILSLIPSVQLVGLSGSLSMENCNEADDIDFFIITSQNSLWITRIIIYSLLLLLKMNRRKNDNFAMNKICVNMYVSEEELEINRENLFTAHEITQLKVLVNKNKIYERFLYANKWISRFLPNSTISKQKNSSKKNTHKKLQLINKFLYWSQYLYMRRSITKERISLAKAEFHPKDKTEHVLSLYRLKSRTALKFYNFIVKPNQDSSMPINTPGY